MAAIATGIFTHQLDWTMILIGLAVGAGVIAVDAVLARGGGEARVPVLAVGIGIYLPPEISVTIVIGAFVGWLINQALRRRARAAGLDPEQALERPGRRGVLIASGLIVGESLIGVLMAGVIGASGSQAPLALVGAGFAPTAQWLGLAAFVLVCAAFFARVVSAGRDGARRVPP